MLRIAQLQRDSMAFQESQDTAGEFKSAVQIVSPPPTKNRIQIEVLACSV
jgi:hypothetical protein